MKVSVLTRPGCHLCDDAVVALRRHLSEKVAGGSAIEIEEIDIESDERLHLEFLERIPVIRIEGEIVSEFAFEPDEFDAALASHSRGTG